MSDRPKGKANFKRHAIEAFVTKRGELTEKEYNCFSAGFNEGWQKAKQQTKSLLSG